MGQAATRLDRRRATGAAARSLREIPGGGAHAKDGAYLGGQDPGGGDPFHGEVEIGDGHGASLRFGLDRSVGGLHDAPNPGDLLCAALAACEDGTIRMIANLLGVELIGLEVEVNGELDVRGCLAADAGVRVGFDALACNVRLAAVEGTDRKRLDALVAAAERYCVNQDTLRGGIEVTTAAEPA